MRGRGSGRALVVHLLEFRMPHLRRLSRVAREPWLDDGPATDPPPQAEAVLQPGSIGKEDPLPPTSVHFNGGVNLPDAETVMREITSRVPHGVSRIPDGETGDRQQWIFFQLQKFWGTPGLEQAPPVDLGPGYDQMPKVRLADGASPDGIQWPNLGYADAYIESFGVFDRLQAEGIIGPDVRFQVE
jgi:hypothetical protein